MELNLEEIKAAARAAGGGQWTASERIVWFDDGDSAMHADPARAKPPVFLAHDNLGAWPDPIAAEDVAKYSALVCPAAILALVERLERAEAAYLDLERRRAGLEQRLGQATAQLDQANSMKNDAQADLAKLRPIARAASQDRAEVDYWRRFTITTSTTWMRTAYPTRCL